MPPKVSASELLTLTARPPRSPRLYAPLSLMAVPKKLVAVECDWLWAAPPQRPRARESLLLIATPPTVAATLSLSANAGLQEEPWALAWELLTASP